jgi:hypothetical protein
MNKKWLLPALTLALIGTSAPASATNILFASGEDSGFKSVSIYGFASTSAGTFRSGWARGSLEAEYGSNIDWVSPLFATTSGQLWIHAQLNTQNWAGANYIALAIYSPDGDARILLRTTATSGQFKISTENAAQTITDLATASSDIGTATLAAIDLNINYTCDGTGGASLYENGVQVINYSGNPCTDSATSLNQVGLGGINSGTQTYWSEVIVADGDTRGMGLYTASPAAAGNTQSWTPNTLADINKTSVNDSTYISTTTTGALSEWTVTNSLPSGPWAVLAVAQDARVEVGTTGPQHFEWLARTGGTDNVTGSVAPLAGSFSNFNQIWMTNPNTGLAWTTTDVTAAGFNLGIESLN